MEIVLTVRHIMATVTEDGIMVTVTPKVARSVETRATVEEIKR